MKVKFDHFGYLKGILGSIVNLRCPVFQGHLEGKIGSLPKNKLGLKFIIRKGNKSMVISWIFNFKQVIEKFLLILFS